MSAKRTYLSFEKRNLVLGLIGLITLAVLAYAVHIGRLGFYRDDWYMVWAGTLLGADEISTLVLFERPVRTLFYEAAYSLIGNNVLGWHLTSLVLRIGSAAAFLWVLRQVWPRQNVATLLMASLFLIYPGFLQQPNAFLFSPNYLALLLASLSIGLTVSAMSTGSKFGARIKIIGALVLALAYWRTYEYMIGLEALRILLIFILIRRAGSKSKSDLAMRTLRSSAPYLAAAAAYLAWYLFFFSPERQIMDASSLLAAIFNDPLRGIVQLTTEWLKDIAESSVFAWLVPAYSLASEAGNRAFLTAGIVASFAVLAIVVLVWRMGIGDSEVTAKIERDWPKEAVLVGGLTLCVAALPVLLAGRNFEWNSAFDRFGLHLSMPISIFVVGLLYLALSPRAARLAAFALVWISIFTHFNNGESWGDYWKAQSQMWWQLSWRAPNLDNGTTIVANIPDFAYFEDYEAWAPANLIYNDQALPLTIAAEILNETTAGKVRVGAQESMYMRTLPPTPRNYDRSLILFLETPDSCLHLIAPDILDIPTRTTSHILSLSPFGRTDVIDIAGQARTPSEDIFGAEPDHNWCYYYQKGSLARQHGDWEQVARLGDEAIQRGLRAQDRSEWMPFLEAYIATGDEAAAQLAANHIREKEPVRHYICDHLGRSYLTGQDQLALLEDLLCEFD